MSGEAVENPRWLRENLAQLEALQQARARCKRGARRYRKLTIAIARLHRDIANRRKDALHMKKADIEKAKQSCGYDAKPTFPTCGNCAAFAMDLELPDWMQKRNAETLGAFDIEQHGVQKNPRCEAFGFSTKKTATCREWRAKS